MFISDEVRVGVKVREVRSNGTVVSIDVVESVASIDVVESVVVREIVSICAVDVLAVVDLISHFLVGLILGIMDRACVIMYRLNLVVFEDDLANVKGLGLVEITTFVVVIEQLISSEPSLQSGKSSHCHLKLMHSPFWHLN